MSASKFELFRAALEELCRRHHVVIGPADQGGIGVRDAVQGVEVPLDLRDYTESTLRFIAAQPKAKPIEGLPDHFETGIAAQAFPGFVGQERTRGAADRLASQHPGSRVVPIGPHRFIRGYAVIAPAS